MRKLFFLLIVLTLLLCCSCTPFVSIDDPSAEPDSEGGQVDHIHLFEMSIRPATCTEPSFTVYTCECGSSSSYEVAGTTLSHEFSQWAASTAATCLDVGVMVRECVDCGKKETQTVTALGHSFGEWEVSKAATAALEGLSARVCSACGLVEEQILPATGSAGLEILDGVVIEIGTCSDSELFIPLEADGDSVEEIGERAFVNCEELTTATVPRSVTKIGYRAFYNCSSLQVISIPQSVRSIGKEAFGACSSLQYIYFEGTKTDFDRLFAEAALPEGVKVIYK